MLRKRRPSRLSCMAVLSTKRAFAGLWPIIWPRNWQHPNLTTLHMRQLILEVCRSDERVIQGAAHDLIAVRERDPACHSYLQAFLYFKGFMALQTHRIAHHLLGKGRKLMAYHLQSRSAELFSVDINPGAKFGVGIMLDHASGLVAGETSVVGDGCSILAWSYPGRHR